MSTEKKKKFRVDLRAEDWLETDLQTFKNQHPDIWSDNELVHQYISSLKLSGKEPEKPAEIAGLSPTQHQDSPRSDVAETSQQAQKLTITSDVPLGAPVDKEKQEWIRDFGERHKANSQIMLPIPPCPFASKAYIEEVHQIQMCFCDNQARNQTKKPGPIAVPLTVCAQCYERREFVKRKKEREEENHPVTPLEIPKHVYEKTLTEKIDDGTLIWNCKRSLIEEHFPLKELPCLLDHTYVCGNKECDQKLTKIITQSNERDFARRGITFNEAERKTLEEIREAEGKL
jgi:hypothetical protein